MGVELAVEDVRREVALLAGQHARDEVLADEVEGEWKDFPIERKIISLVGNERVSLAAVGA